MKFQLRGKTYKAYTYQELCAKYVELRIESDEGASTFPTPQIFDDNWVLIGRISYNGKIWGLAEELLFNPNGA